jgi:hypothetical protein
MNDSSELATTHALRALAYPIATWCTPHDGSHQNRREFSRFPVSGRCKVLQSGASKQTDMKVVAGARFRLIARSSFRSRAVTAAARLPASRFPTTVVTGNVGIDQPTSLRSGPGAARDHDWRGR